MGLEPNSPAEVVVESERAGGTEASLQPRGEAPGNWELPRSSPGKKNPPIKVET